MSDGWEDMTSLQSMVMAVLAARARLGEESWLFRAGCRRVLEALAGRDMLSYERVYESRTYRARLTEAGRQWALSGTYQAPVTKLVDRALFLCQNGERPPGSESETWAAWTRDAELFLRRQLTIPLEDQ